MESNRITKTDLLMSEAYREYELGFRYIPYQDLPKFEKAYRKVNNISTEKIEIISYFNE